jgi:hypothetical protein
MVKIMDVNGLSEIPLFKPALRWRSGQEKEHQNHPHPRHLFDSHSIEETRSNCVSRKRKLQPEPGPLEGYDEGSAQETISSMEDYLKNASAYFFKKTGIEAWVCKSVTKMIRLLEDCIGWCRRYPHV